MQKSQKSSKGGFTRKRPASSDPPTPIEEEDVNEKQKQSSSFSHIYMQEDYDDEDAYLVDSNVQVEAGGDVISKCRLLDIDKCPRIPLCRLIPYARVRGLRADLSALKSAFESEEYVPEKGAFIVSTCTEDGKTADVTPEVVDSWDSLWKVVNAEFEKEVISKKALKFMSNRMLFVWEGNHRTKAFMEVIDELYKEDLKKHIRVMCTIIDPQRVSEISLLAGLQRMNTLNEHAFIKPSLRDVLINTNNICQGDPTMYMKTVSAEEAKLLSTQKKESDKRWFPFSRGYLARMIFQVEYSKEVKNALSGIDKSLGETERQDAERKEKTKIQKRLSDRMSKVLTVIHPRLGDVWKKRLFELQFEGKDSIVTLEKLRLLSASELSTEKRVKYLKLLESPKLMRDSYDMPSRDHDFRIWVQRETFLDKIGQLAHALIDALVDSGDFPYLGDSVSLQSYWDMIKQEGKKHVFQNLRVKDTRGELQVSKTSIEAKQNKHTDLDKASQRLVYRYMRHLLEKKSIASMPASLGSWIDLKNEQMCMYPLSIQKKLSSWEIFNCPWWLDCHAGVVLKNEEVSFKEHASTQGRLSKVSSPKISSKRIEDKKSIQDKGLSLDLDGYGESSEELLEMSPQVQKKEIMKENVFYVYIGDMIGVNKSINPLESSCAEGDYIIMGRDFSQKRLNASYTKIHDFFLHVIGHSYLREVDFLRCGKKVSWAANLIVLDFPTGLVDGKPSWDALTEEHVRYGIMVAGASVSDMGWLVCFAPLQGPSLTWIEKYIFTQGMVIARRVIVQDKEPYVSTKVGSTTCLHRRTMLLFAHRANCNPPMHFKESATYFEKLKIDASCDSWTHYILKEKMASVEGSTLRGIVERSVCLITAIVALCTSPRSLVIEMGCGTAPVLRSCLSLGRSCFAFDSDVKVIKQFVEPLIVEWGKKPATTNIDADVSMGDYEIDPIENPYD